MRLIAFSVLLLACVAPIASAQPPDCVALDGSPATPNKTDANGLIARVEAPCLRLLRTTAKEPKGTALIFPSGGYHVLSIVSDGTEKAKFWNDLGYDAAVLEYTISTKGWQRDDAVRARAHADALAAVGLVRGKGKELALHEGRFVLMGGSAGGHLATRTVAALPEKDRPDLLVLFYPAYLEEAPPGTEVPGMPVPKGKLPRLFAAIAADDNAGWVKGIGAYTEAWKKAGGEAEFHLFPDGGHGFTKGDALREWPRLLRACVETLPRK